MSKQGYWAIDLEGEEEQLQIFMALLNEAPWQGYEMVEHKVKGYIRCEDADEAFFQNVQFYCNHLGIVSKTHFIAEKNWNALWESNFSPIVVSDQLLIKAPFHTVEEKYPYLITIRPKMAFGTGHHETTYMMLSAMLGMKWQGQSVLDYGSGTAILSVAARMMGAGPVTAVDIQPEAASNAIEHMQLNEVTGIRVLTGDLSSVKGETYEIILANINRNVIMESLKELFKMLPEHGMLLISGILNTDREKVFVKAREVGFSISTTQERGAWICAKLLKCAPS